jgi:hypothetical protein
LLEGLIHSEDPHHHEEGHHGRHEIGVGHFPSAPMVPGVAVCLFHDDDDVDDIYANPPKYDVYDDDEDYLGKSVFDIDGIDEDTSADCFESSIWKSGN